MRDCFHCGKTFAPSYVFQVAATKHGERCYFCSIECRKEVLGGGQIVPTCRKIAVLNQKGGTGKTTTSVNIAAGCAERGKKVLLIDSDAQGNVGASLGIQGQKTLYNVLVDGANEIDDIVVPVRNNLDVITCETTLAAAEIWLARQGGERGKILTQRLARLRVPENYDYIFIDCGPSLNLLNQNALSFANEVIIPVTCDYLALIGVKQVLRTIEDLERHLNHQVKVTAVLPTFYDGRTRIGREVLEKLRGRFQEKCLDPIRLNTRLAEAPSHRKTIFEYAPCSHGAEDYSKIVDWLISTSSHATQTAQSAA
jgi:chromosome partitioning protein